MNKATVKSSPCWPASRAVWCGVCLREGRGQVACERTRTGETTGRCGYHNDLERRWRDELAREALIRPLTADVKREVTRRVVAMGKKS